jgi:hypothetical protein
MYLNTKRFVSLSKTDKPSKTELKFYFKVNSNLLIKLISNS